jgi:putative transposase
MLKNKAVYVAIAPSKDGGRKVLGMWIAGNEIAKFWWSVMIELKNRGVQQFLIAVADAIAGM